MKDTFYTRYVGRYVGAYIIMTALFAATAFVPALDGIPNSFAIVIAMIAAYWPGMRFAQDHNRRPEKSEKRKFAAASLLIVTVLSGLVFALIWAMVVSPEEKDMLREQFADFQMWWFIPIMFVVLLIYYGVIGWGFSTGAKMQLKAAEKAQAKGKV